MSLSAEWKDYVSGNYIKTFAKIGREKAGP